MPDILNDPPTAFAAGVPAIPGSLEDLELHTLSLESLEALNLFLHRHRGAPGLLTRSVIEDGAVVGPGTDNTAFFQATLDAVGAAGGGVVLVPPTPGSFFELAGPITVPHGVVLRGVEERTVLAPSTTGVPVLRFEEGTHRGGVENLTISPLEGVRPSVGIDLSGTHFLRVRNVFVRLCETGLVLSDGISEPEGGRFAGYNLVSDFELDACAVGILARRHCNQAVVRDGRIHFARAEGGAGIAIDVDGATALAFGQIAVENFDLGVRIRGRTSVSLRDVYYEADTPDETEPGRWLDVAPDLRSIVRFENSHVEASRSVVLGGSLEDAITSDERSHIHFGAKRHHAAAAERNLIENGDFHRADGIAAIPRWAAHQGPVVAEVTTDFVTGGRSYDITQAVHPDDALTTAFVVPETTDFVTVMVRFKNLGSDAATFRVFSGGNAADFLDPQPPDPDHWRTAAIAVEVDPAAAGLIQLFAIADASAAGGRIRLDEAWAVVGATAAPPRAHAHRVELLSEPVRVVTREAVAVSQRFPPTDLTALPGLGGAPRGVVGALLGLRGRTDEPGAGALRQRLVRPFLRDPDTGRTWSLDLTVRGVESDRQVLLRQTVVQDGIAFAGNDTPPTDYAVDLLGWILPS